MSIDATGKSLVDLLDMLEPAPMPPPVSMLPQTWGWLAVAAVVLGGLAGGIFVLLQHRKANAYRRYALQELAAAQNSAAQIATILRQTALAAYPRTQVAGLYGKDWLNFLEQSAENVDFSGEEGAALLRAPYHETPSNLQLTDLARHWIKTHKVGGGM